MGQQQARAEPAHRTRTPFYRHRFDSDVVHFHADCPQWPVTRYVVLPDAPPAGRCCPVCQARAECNTSHGQYHSYAGRD